MDNYKTELTFKDVDQGWVTARLKDICEVNPTTVKLPDEFVYIDLESVVDGLLLKEKNISKKNAPSRAQRVLQKNDILFQMVRPYQKNNLFFDKEGLYVASTGYAQIRTKFSPLYFYHFFHTDIFVNEVLKKCTGSNYPAINSSDLSNLIIHYPLSIIHSSKIASCLSSLDEVISAHSQKLDLLKHHKKGLMQNLFPQEGEKVPKYRFKEFEKDGEWVEKKLGDLAENVMYGINSAAIEFDGENKYIRITDIDENTRTFSPNPVTSPNGQLDDKYLLKKGDILFARTGASVGKSYIHQIEGDNIYFAGFLIRISIKDDFPYFIYVQTLTEKYQKWVTKTSMRSGQPGINAEEYKLYTIFLPPTIQEQQKIASCLSSLDALITAQSEKIAQLKLHKKGLMQGLFPNSITNYELRITNLQLRGLNVIRNLKFEIN